jgi:predicted RNase H-like HicB family nuclease
MKLKVVVHKAEEGGFWAEVPSIPGCVSQGETMEEVISNVHEAIEGCLSFDMKEFLIEKETQIIEIAV